MDSKEDGRGSAMMARKRTANDHDRGKSYDISSDCCYGIGRTGSYYVDERAIIIEEFDVRNTMYGVKRSKKTNNKRWQPSFDIYRALLSIVNRTTPRKRAES